MRRQQLQWLCVHTLHDLHKLHFGYFIYIPVYMSQSTVRLIPII